MRAQSTASSATRCPACGLDGPTADALVRCPCGRGVFVASAGDPLAGRLVDGIAIGEPIGAGATARVYAAHDGRQPLALKVLRADASERARRRFAREARALGALRGPHTVGLVAFGEARDRRERLRLWLAQPRVSGASLAERLIRGPLAAAELPPLADGLLRALEEAHGAGVVHRDLKPAHIVLTADGGVVVLDFGLARIVLGETEALTTTGAIVGTPHYMAPEQIDQRAPVGPAADLYAAAVVLYEACAGRRPFEALDPLLVLRGHLDTPPPRLPRRAPRGWASALARGLAKAPADRFPSAAAMRRALIVRRPFWRRG